ncbi:Hsp70 family protein [Longispora sp. K20-0274]|uniref:Hsp70 family protein n=1 Tax=Longispora sp. K20-0274 TaxID=3088255 RepID=UPI003999F2EF
MLTIDFGSAHTVAALRTPAGQVTPLLFDGSPLLPSGVYAAAADLFTGRDAEQHARYDPAGYEPTPKRRIDDGEVLLGGRTVPVPDLIAAVLDRVRAEAVRVAGHLPAVVLTHPASWGTPRRDVLRAAARRAGLGEVELVAEPVAAAAYHTAGRAAGRGPLLVVDPGAGTLDIAVLRPTGVAAGTAGDRYITVGLGGLDDLGGLDLDAALLAHLAERWPDPAWSARGPAVPTAVRIAKEALSEVDSTVVAAPGLRSEVRLDRATLATVAAPYVDCAVRAVLDTLDAAGVRAADLGGVCLVGGGSRLDALRVALADALGDADVLGEQPELAVAEGAAHAVPEEDVEPPTAVPAAVAPPTRRRRTALIIGAVLVLLAAAAVVVLRWPHGTPPAAKPPADPTAIRTFDPASATWTVLDLADELATVPLVDGHAVSDNVEWTVRKDRLYADLDGDGDEDLAVAIHGQAIGGKLYRQYWYVWLWRDGRAAQLTRPVATEGWTSGTIDAMTVVPGGLEVKRREWTWDGGNTADGGIEPQTYVVAVRGDWPYKVGPRLAALCCPYGAKPRPATAQEPLSPGATPAADGPRIAQGVRYSTVEVFTVGVAPVLVDGWALCRLVDASGAAFIGYVPAAQVGL